MAITRQTGFPTDASGVSQTTLAVTPVAVGDLLIVSGRILANNPVTNVTGGGANTNGWSKVGDGYDGTTYVYLWACTIGTTGAQTITVTFTNTGTSNHIAADSWHSGLGATTVWTAEDLNQTHTTASSATVTYPSLTPLTTFGLYLGYGREASTFSSGATTGFTYTTLTNVGNVLATNPTVTSGTAYQPTYTQSSPGESMTVASIFGAALPAAALTDTIVLSESLATTTQHPRTLTGTLALAESLTRTAHLPRALADTIALANSLPASSLPAPPIAYPTTATLAGKQTSALISTLPGRLITSASIASKSTSAALATNQTGSTLATKQTSGALAARQMTAALAAKQTSALIAA